MKAIPIKVLVCCCIVLVFSESVSAQQYHLYYKLVKGTDTVGDLSVVDTKTSGKRTIYAALKAEIPALLFHISLRDEKASEYSNQVLQSAVVTRSFFSNNTDKSTTLLRNNYYTDGISPIASLSEKRKIDFSMTMLYTTEPVGIQLIYSEFHQVLVPVEQIAEHVYRIITPEGQVGVFYYEKGLCIRIETKTTWTTINTILINNTIALN